jgi:hypothetical protein
LQLCCEAKEASEAKQWLAHAKGFAGFDFDKPLQVRSLVFVNSASARL